MTSPGVHDICDDYVARYAALNPLAATEFGISGHDNELPDLSPEGHAARAELARSALAALAAATPAEASEAVAATVFRERIGLAVEMHEAGLPVASLNMIASPAQDIRQAFDLMPTASTADWVAIAERFSAVPQAIDGYQQSLRLAVDRGQPPAARQVRRVIEQCETWAAGTPGAFFTDFPGSAPELPGPVRAALDTGARAAAGAYAGLAAFLRETIAHRADPEDAVGAQRYQLWSQNFLGATIDLRDAYDWGWAEFHRIETEIAEVAGRIAPGAGLAEAAAVLDADPRYRVDSADAFRDWMQELSDNALADLRGKHFDIPDELMRLDCRIAPPGGGSGAYYTNPADDFSRPGQMWWGLPAGQAEFPTWRQVSTVYHEGVPGHHLQIGTAVATAGLNRFQRLLCFIDGHGEGWALYAERLMREFGYLDDGGLLGMLSQAVFRAARVILDIGMHLKLPIPAGSGFHDGECWTPELGLEFLLARTSLSRARAVDEIDRYLGWPGQATAYKLGERLWLQLRDEAKARQGSEFDLRSFHMHALRSGPAGLDAMREILAAG